MSPFTVPIAGMIFILLMILITGGLKLLSPVATNLGAAMEQWLADRRAGSLVSAEEVAELRREVEEMQTELLRLTEGQQFMERLLEERGPAADRAGEPMERIPSNQPGT